MFVLSRRGLKLFLSEFNKVNKLMWRPWVYKNNNKHLVLYANDYITAVSETTAD